MSPWEIAMGNRLSSITTRTGDDGTTGLADNSRLPKSHPRLQAIGDVDELNAHLGLLLCENMPVGVRQLLVQVQHQLFDFGGELAMPGHALLNIDALKALDLALQEYNARLPALQEFILPAGVRSVCLAHVCRTVARRAERSLVALVQTQPVRPELLQYLNRLSDLFFVLARTFSQEHEGAEVFWQSQRLAMQDNKK